MSRPDGYLVGGLAADAVVAEVARGFRVTVDDIMGRRQAAHITAARACAMTVIRSNTNWSWITIASYFGRQHQTVMRAVGLVLADDVQRAQAEAVAAEMARPSTDLSPDPCTIKSRGCIPSHQQAGRRKMGHMTSPEVELNG